MQKKTDYTNYRVMCNFVENNDREARPISILVLYKVLESVTFNGVHKYVRH